MNRRDMLALLLGAMSSGASLARPAGAPLRVMTTHLPPLVFESGEQPGALRELVDALFAQVGVKAEQSFVPWQRALHVATTMPRTVIYPLTRLPAREAQFRWLAPLYEENFVFLAPHGSSFDVRRPHEMKDKRIALMRGAAQSAMLREMGFTRVVEAASIDEVHRFMLAGMADAAFGERAIVRRALAMRGHQGDFRISGPLRSSTAWLGGSLDIGEDEARRYRAAMAKLVADGTQRRIFKRYGLL